MFTIRSRSQEARQPTSAPRERRSYPRHRPVHGTTCLVRLRPGGAVIKATVRNISARGLALVSATPIELGAVLIVQLVNGVATFCLEARLRVTRVDPMLSGDYVVAGELDHVLEPAELLPFLM